MRIGFRGELSDEVEIRAGFIGCGSHSFRNILPTLQFAPVNLVATCDLSVEKAQAFAAKFGAPSAYADYREMLAGEKLDAVFVVTGYDEHGRPTYPRIARDCLQGGCHVWIEKPPAASCREIDDMRKTAIESGRLVMVGFKKMFCPANQHAKALARNEEFGEIALVTMQYPQHLPAHDEFVRYVRDGENLRAVVGFLDHFCHPGALLLYLLGMPQSMYYDRSPSGAAVASFTFASGIVASLAFTHGASRNGGMERTTIVSNSGKHIVVDNNIRVSYHRNPVRGYGDVPSFFVGTAEQATAVWEPEFSLGQLYNKGLFLLGYYDEVNEFARSIIEGRPLANGTLEQAWQVTRMFEAFAEGPGRPISLAMAEDRTREST
jgi:predicted dehydrogenase